LGRLRIANNILELIGSYAPKAQDQRSDGEGMKRDKSRSLGRMLLVESIAALVLASVIGHLAFSYADFRAVVVKHLGTAEAVPRSSVERVLEAADASHFVALPCIAAFLILVAVTQFRLFKKHHHIKKAPMSEQSVGGDSGKAAADGGPTGAPQR
jgi:hypothetical protein